MVLIFLGVCRIWPRSEIHSKGDKYHNEFEDGSPPALPDNYHVRPEQRPSAEAWLPSRPAYGKISSPFQSQHLPLPSSPTFPVTTSTIFSAANSGSNNLPLGTDSQKSRLKSVLTVPG